MFRGCHFEDVQRDRRATLTEQCQLIIHAVLCQTIAMFILMYVKSRPDTQHIHIPIVAGNGWTGMPMQILRP